RDPVDHVRAVKVLDDGTLLVLDRLASTRRHRYVQTWPLHPALDAIVRDNGSVEASVDGEPRLHLSFASDSTSEARLRRGERDPPAGWWSRRLEEAEPAWTADHEVDCAGGASLAALVVVVRGRTPADPQLRLRRVGRTTQVTFVHDG